MALNTYMRNGTGMFRFASMSDFMSGHAPIEMAFDWGFDGDEYPSAKVRFAQIGAYVQDEWTVNDRFKLTAGLRLDNLSFNNKDVMTNNETYKLDFGGKHVDTGKWPKTSIQVSPRLGFSWDVFGDKSLKVRGGTGLFSGRIPLVFFTNMPTNAGIVKGRMTKMKDPEVLSRMMAGGHLVTDRWAILDILNGIDPDKYPTSITPETAPAPSEVAGVDYHFKMPQVWKSSLAVDYSFPTPFPLTISAEYIFNKTINGVMLHQLQHPGGQCGLGDLQRPRQTAHLSGRLPVHQQGRLRPDQHEQGLGLHRHHLPPVCRVPTPLPPGSTFLPSMARTSTYCTTPATTFLTV